MKFISAIPGEDGVRVICQRGDNSEFSWITMTPERYGYPAPVETPVERLTRALEERCEELAQYEAATPIPQPHEFKIVKDHDGKPREVNLLDLRNHNIEIHQTRIQAAQELLDRAREAFDK